MKSTKIIASSLVFLIGIAAFIICFIAKDYDNKIKQLGFITSAVIVDLEKEVHKSSEGLPGRATTFKKETFWGIYKFAVGKKSYLVRGKTSGGALGQKTKVYYDPGDPGKKYVLEADQLGFAIGITVASFFLIIGAVLSYRSYML